MFFLYDFNVTTPGQVQEKGRTVCDRSKTGGARRDRTDDLMLAKHALYQLSYGPSGYSAELSAIL